VGALVVEYLKGDVVESAHPVRFAVVGPNRIERVLRYHHFRSAAKPLQGLVTLRVLLEHFDLSDEEVAVACSSHSGTDEHAEAVLRILDRVGLDESALRCGVHEPLDRGTRDRMKREGKKFTPVRHNCSGKHAAMAVACVLRRWPLEDYRLPGHPLQKEVMTTVSRFAGLPARRVKTAVDGCGVVEFALPLWRMALAYRRFFGEAGPHSEVADRIWRAVAARPKYIAGDGMIGTELSRATSGRVLVKTGGAGVRVGFDAGSATAFAVKCITGFVRPPTSARPVQVDTADVGLMAVMRNLGLLSAEELAALEPFEKPPILNAHGFPHGSVRVKLL